MNGLVEFMRTRANRRMRTSAAPPVLGAVEDTRHDNDLVTKIAWHIGTSIQSIQEGDIEMFSNVDKELGERIAKQIKEQDEKASPNAHDRKEEK